MNQEEISTTKITVHPNPRRGNTQQPQHTTHLSFARVIWRKSVVVSCRSLVVVWKKKLRNLENDET